jgi:Tol biopolymer transport system component
MSLSPGSRLGAYEITAPLGAGGMGEVYRATDTKLGRQVAIKVLPSAVASDARYMARLEREAQLLAALNHPNIAGIYGVESGALVMELVEGATLAERIRVGPVPVDDALPIARQIAEGLEAAHERGIVHRDLKPANIKITPEGVVKLLDFGLAKAAEEMSAAASSATMSPTLSLAMTQAGMILGTAAYMSPEQARGKPVDRRADIWAFGVVLYEMLVGRQLFGGGETITDTLASVVKEAPDWNALPTGTPPHIRRLLERCLRKDAKSRLRDIGEARILIDEPTETPAAAVPAPKRRLAWLPWAVAGMLGAGLAGMAWRTTHPALKPLMRLNVELGPDATLTRSNGGAMLALSADGTRLAVTYRGTDGKPRLGTRLLHQNQVTPLSGTEESSYPFFSPDGRWIGFFADGKLKKVAVEGGATVTLCDAVAVRGASWADDGNIIVALGNTAGLSRVPAAGGTPTPLTKLNPGERTHRWPQVLPGTRAVLFTAHTGAGNYDDASIEVLSLKTGERKTVQRGGFSGRYLPSGHLVYMHQGTLFAALFDLARLAVSGAPVPVVEDASSGGGAGGDFAVASSGTFVYVTGRTATGGWPIFWLDSSGKTRTLHARPGIYREPRFSPDGKRLAFSITTGQGDDIWVKDLDRDTPSRLSFLPGQNRYPVWTPDGKNIVFRSQNPTSSGLYWIHSDGSGEAQRLTDDKLPLLPYSFSPDGKRLALMQLSGAGGSPDIMTAPIEGGAGHPRLGKLDVFVGTPFTELDPAFSPDGRWLAYASNESGTFEIYVRPFPGPGGRWQISTGVNGRPVWSPDGRELFFLSREQRIMATLYTARGDSFIAGRPRVWAEARVEPIGNAPIYDVAPDGKRFAVMLSNVDSSDQKPLTHVTFLLNFFDELRRRVPVNR